MKKLIKILSLALVLVFTLGLVACSSYGKLEKAFEKEGYVKSEKFDGALTQLREDAERNDFIVTPYMFTKGDGLSSDIVWILEFNATEDLKEYVKNSDKAQSFVKDVKENEDAQAFYDALVEAGYVNGNCLVISTNPLNRAEVIRIVKNA